MIISRRTLALALVGTLLAGAALAQSSPQLESPTIRQIPPGIPVLAQHGMVVAQESRAAHIGSEILRRGGNAVDAAVATGFALAVTYPRAGNIGGGGFMVIHLAGRNLDTTIDYREVAPAATTRDMFLDANGDADPQKSRDSALAVGVPGTVAGLALALAKYGSGKFTLADLIEPAFALARDGIPIEDDTADSIPLSSRRLARWPSSRKIFFRPDGSSLRSGDRLIQSDLANTMAAIMREGPKGFYQGPVAQTFASAIQAAGGIMTAEDLKDYRAIERPPVRGTYRGYDIVSMPPSSSGGVLLIEMLNILEGYDLSQPTAQRLHYMIEAMKRAYADRATYLGDPAMVHAPIEQLMSKDYAATVRARIDPAHAAAPGDVRQLIAPPRESPNTTHFSVIDADGNAVASTYTLNFSFGVGMVAEGTGVLVNNELDDFAAKPDAPNAYGLTGGEANAPGPGKRPLSSMTPTIVLRDGKPFIVTGTPGGSRIITAVLQVISSVIDLKMPIADAVAAPRLHQQWLPEQVFTEPGIAPEILSDLAARGHHIAPGPPFTSENSIAVTPDGYVGAADPRTRGATAVGN